MRRTNLRTTRTALLVIGLVAIVSPMLHARSLPIPIAMPLVAEDYELVDVTGDGHVDLVVATEVGRKLAVLPGDGTGGFGGPIVTEAPGDTEDLLVADFDGDGALDAALIGSAPGGLVIALGNGDGSFRIEHTPEGIGNVASGATADFDGDAVLDLILVERFADALVPLRGVGDGTFERGPDLPIPSLHRVAVGDFTHDGVVDIVATSFAVDAMLLPGLGDGTFGPARTLGVAGRAIHARDLDGDSRLDLVFGTSLGLVVALSKPDATFELLPPVPNDAREFVDTTDIDGDGDPDVVTTSLYFTSLRLFENDGTGRLHPRRSYFVPETTALALGDTDGDGFDDAVIGRSDSLWTFRGAGRRGFEGPRAFGVGPNAWSIECADFDRDGRVDVAVSIDEGIRILRGFRGGGLQAVELVPAPGIANIVAADFDGDGHVDLAGARQGAWVLFRNEGSGFGPERRITKESDARLATVDDFDGDGDLDIAVLRSPAAFEPGSVLVLSNQGTRFEAAIELETSEHPMAIEHGDFDGDGNIDLAVLCGDVQRLEVFRGDGSGAFELHQALNVQNWPRQIVAGDFDHDGRDDMFVSLDRSINETEPGYWILRGTTNGLTFARGEYADFIAQGATVVDYDADGHLDIIKVAIGYFPTILRGDGSFGFEPTPYLRANDAFTDLVVGHFDTDSALDIVLSGADSGILALILAPELPPQAGPPSR